MGHFLAAKWLKVPVKIFSIGFPLGNLPPLIKFNWGETECQLNLLPLGGFCAFMDDDKEVEKIEDDQRLLNNRKVWERFVVISGGVVFNFIFAIFIAIVMFFSLGIPEGREFNDGVFVVDVKGSSPADKAGIKAMDTIIAVDDTNLTFENDITKSFENILTLKNEVKNPQIGFITPDGDKKDVALEDNKNALTSLTTEEVRGILVSRIIEGGTGEKAGIQKNDIILEIGDKSFRGAKNPEGLMKEVLNKALETKTNVAVKLLRSGENKTLEATPNADGKLGVGIEFIKGLIVKKNTSKLDIPLNSIIIEANDSSLADTSSMMRQLIAKHKDGTVAKVKVKRRDEVLSLDIVPDNAGLIGVQIQGAIKEVRRAPNSFGEPFIYSFNFIAGTTVLLCDGLFKMVTGQLSSGEVGGPIMVVAKGAEIAQADFSKLFQFSILLSIELVILNLLPLPAVDGGHLFLLIIEKIRGRRLPKEFEEKIHYAGLIVLLGLGVFLIFKDVLTLSKIVR
jgi:RIP metalloprotease RseP